MEMSGEIFQPKTSDDKQSQPTTANHPGKMGVMKGNANMEQQAAGDARKCDKKDPNTTPQHIPKATMKQPQDLEMDAEIISLSDEDNTKGDEETEDTYEEGQDKEEMHMVHQEVGEDGGKGEAGCPDDDDGQNQNQNQNQPVIVKEDNLQQTETDVTESIQERSVSIQEHQEHRQQQHQEEQQQQRGQQIQEQRLPGSQQQIAREPSPQAYNIPTTSQNLASDPNLQLQKPSKKKKIMPKMKGIFGKKKDKKRKKGNVQATVSMHRTTQPVAADASISGVASVDLPAASVEDIAKLCLADDDENDSSASSSSSSTDDTLRESGGGQSRLQSTGDPPPLGMQESSSKKDGQLVTGISLSLDDESFDDCDGAYADEVEDLPKKEPPRLDMSQTLVIKNEAPKIPPRRRKSCRPTENYYDILIIHSDCKGDWKEVDYVKKIAKRYKWKVISMEEFPAGMTKFEIFSTMLARCTYTLLLMTKHFFPDVWCQHRYAACLTAAIENRQHHWSVIPVIYCDSGYETPLELATIAGLQRKARYFHKNMRSSISSAKRREREESIGVFSEPSPPASPPNSPLPISPPLSPTYEAAPPKLEVHVDTSNMTAGELYRLRKPELTPTEPIAKFFRDDDRFRRICELLDEEHALARDYRLLAQMVGFDAGEIRTLAKEKSPTAKILEVYCLKNADKEKLEVLETFKKMVTALEQEEVKKLVENEIMVATFT